MKRLARCLFVPKGVRLSAADRKAVFEGGYTSARVRVDVVRGARLKNLTTVLFPEAKSQGLVVDHKNGVTTDFRRSNLRLVTRSTNARNRRAVGLSAFLGVSWSGRLRMWIAHISDGGRIAHLGCYRDECEAAIAYNRAVTRVDPGVRLNPVEDHGQVLVTRVGRLLRNPRAAALIAPLPTSVTYPPGGGKVEARLP